MRRVAALLLLTIPSPAAGIDQLDWLAGQWTGTAGKASYEEHWTSPKAGLMIGMSRTTVGDRAAGFEYLRIVARDGDVFYVAQPNGRPPTEFKLAKIEGASATFENPGHDFPKIITYRHKGGELIATIEGEVNGKQRKQEFRMRRAPSQSPETQERPPR